MSFGSSQDKDNVWWWFLKSFKQSVRGTVTKHVDFVYDVDLVAGLVGGIIDLFTEAPNIINSSVTGSINFYDIKGSTIGYCLAYGASIAGLPFSISKTVNCLGQDTPSAGLAGSSWSTKEVSMRYTATTKRVK